MLNKKIIVGEIDKLKIFATLKAVIEIVNPISRLKINICIGDLENILAIDAGKTSNAVIKNIPTI
jgi:hypothetical protein